MGGHNRFRNPGLAAGADARNVPDQTGKSACCGSSGFCWRENLSSFSGELDGEPAWWRAARNMQPERLKREFGKRICFWGGIDKHVARCRKCRDRLDDELGWVAAMRSPFTAKVRKKIAERKKAKR